MVMKPTRRPDGMFVVDEPSRGSSAYSKGLKLGDKVYGSYYDINRRYFRVSGIVEGFVQNDVMIYDKRIVSYVWIDGKNVFKLSRKKGMF